MPQPVVLIIFYSRGGATEKLALAAAVGAVQARALIRLRRVPDADPVKTLAQFPNCRETLVRMHREYVAPAEADVAGADALILASSEAALSSSQEWAGCMELLARLASERKLRLKVVSIADCGSATAFQSFSEAITRMGLPTPPRTSGDADLMERATALGRWTGNNCRAANHGDNLPR